MANCIHCGAVLQGEAIYCSSCGKKQVMRHQQTFRRGNMPEEEFIARINEWFAKYPQVGNVNGKFLLRSGLGLLVNKYVLDAFAIEYEVLDGNNINQYAVVSLSKFGIVKTDTKSLLQEWQQANPNAVIINHNGGVHQRGQTGSLILGGLGAANNTQLYVFFKFNRKAGTAPARETNG